MKEYNDKAENRPKVLALYRAVLELLDEGADINAIKVSDITKRAGIGKGTAYDYFKSKEEIIAGAVIYDMEQRVEEEKERLNQFSDFRQKIEYSFGWILNNFQEQKAFSRFLRLTSHPCEIRRTLLDELKNRESDLCGPVGILREICETGKRQGEIRKEIPASAAAYLTLASMAALVLYLENDSQKEPCGEIKMKPAEMKEFLCRGLLGQLK